MVLLPLVSSSFSPHSFFSFRHHGVNSPIVAAGKLSNRRDAFALPLADSGRPWRVVCCSPTASFDGKEKMNLNEYMVEVERPLGIRFALSLESAVFVHALQKGGNAERSRIVMVGDVVRKASGAQGGGFVEIKDLDDIRELLKHGDRTCSLILERPSSPFPIHQLQLNGDLPLIFNRGRVSLITWNRSLLASNQPSSSDNNVTTGAAIFSSRFLQRNGWMFHSNSQGYMGSQFQRSSVELSKRTNEVVSTISDKQGQNVEWAFGAFPLEEYIKALERAKGELYYNHSLGMQYSKITEQIYVGSCIQREEDVKKLADDLGITAVLNFQSDSERANWGISSESINQSCIQNNILMVNYPIREVDSLDLRKKLPFCVGLLLRLLRKNYRIYVTCTTGFDRSPSCVIAYLHWIQDTALHVAYNFFTSQHTCRPDRAAIVWATWDLVALAENGKSEGPPTHSVTFIWNNGREGEEVFLVGDFTSNWKDTLKANHKGGSRYEVDLKLRHGKYYYKFIVGGQWRHSTVLPTERDERGNVNNVIRVGGIARIRPAPSQLQIKDPTVMKVIERVLTEDERFLLAFAARRMAFAICPVRFCPK